jgi:DNA invertase Pin-like site-specific DNA recombinase
MKLALYARVSKPQRDLPIDAQAKEQNPEVQLRELREWCRGNRHAVALEYVERLSGKNTKRPQLQKLMRDATRGLQDIEGVLVWRLDRFGRSVRDLHNLIAELDEAKIAFICLKDGFDLTTSGGRAMFGMLAVFAEFERNVIAERTKAGLALARAEGRLPGRKIDPHVGPSRTTRWRHAKTRAKA